MAKVLPFGSRRLPFLFLVDQWRELQRETKAGPWEIEARLLRLGCTVDEITAALRIGLVGGGMSATEAFVTVEAHVGTKPGDLGFARLTALAAISHSLHGLDEDLVGESDAAPKGARTSRRRTAKSPGPTSSKPRARRASPRATSDA
ncbi:GTA-gp10 family protein [Caulobacter sp.]|uniref:GTA-gp10 family protein n=1 Tax=Caulobacter sp. TaxID=78 RepID=UPI003BB1EAB8